MRRFTLVLWTLCYLTAALVAAVLVGGVLAPGAGAAAGMAAFIGTLGLCFAFHALITMAVQNARLTGDLATVREAHQILADQLERVDARVGEVVETVARDALRRSEELTSEVHQLEDLVQRMSNRLEDQLSHQVTAARHQHVASDQGVSSWRRAADTAREASASMNGAASSTVSTRPISEMPALVARSAAA